MLGKNVERDSNDLQDACAHCFEHEWISDAAFFDSASEQEECWKIREDVALLEQNAKHNQHYDISIPIDRIGEIIDSIVQNLKNLKGVLGVYPFGHVADGNIHLIVGKENNSEILTQNINDIVYQPLQEIKGSISAEHGIGIDKKPYLHLSRTKPEMELMKAIKLLLDPKNILNPARIIN